MSSRTCFVAGLTRNSAERPPTEAENAISPFGIHSWESGSYCQVPNKFTGAPPATSTT